MMVALAYVQDEHVGKSALDMYYEEIDLHFEKESLLKKKDEFVDALIDLNDSIGRMQQNIQANNIQCAKVVELLEVVFVVSLIIEYT